MSTRLDPMDLKVVRANKKSESFKEGMKQNWTSNNHGYYDQFGFVIERGLKYKLYWKDEYITTTHNLQAAKEISIILINDKIQAS